MAQDRVREGVSGTLQVKGVAYGPDLGSLLMADATSTLRWGSGAGVIGWWW